MCLHICPILRKTFPVLYIISSHCGSHWFPLPPCFRYLLFKCFFVALITVYNCCCCCLVTLCDPVDCSIPGSSVLHYLPEFAQIYAHSVSDAVQPTHPLLPSSPFAFNLSQHQGLYSESALCIGWLKYWSFSLSTSPSNEYSRLIYFRIDWLDLLAVQGTLQSLLQYHSSKASILCLSAFFMVQLSHPYMITGKSIVLT